MDMNLICNLDVSLPGQVIEDEDDDDDNDFVGGGGGGENMGILKTTIFAAGHLRVSKRHAVEHTGG